MTTADQERVLNKSISERIGEILEWYSGRHESQNHEIGISCKKGFRSVDELIAGIEFTGICLDIVELVLSEDKIVSSDKKTIQDILAGRKLETERIIPSLAEASELINSLKADVVYELLEDCLKRLPEETVAFASSQEEAVGEYCKKFGYMIGEKFSKQLKRYFSHYRIEKIIYPLYLSTIYDVTMRQSQSGYAGKIGLDNLKDMKGKRTEPILGVKKLPEYLRPRFLRADERPREDSKSSAILNDEFEELSRLVKYLGSTEYEKEINHSLCLYLFDKYSHMYFLAKLLDKVSDRKAEVDVWDFFHRFAAIGALRTTHFLLNYYTKKDLTPTFEAFKLLRDILIPGLKTFIYNKIYETVPNDTDNHEIVTCQKIYDQLRNKEESNLLTADLKYLASFNFKKHQETYLDIRRAVCQLVNEEKALNLKADI